MKKQKLKTVAIALMISMVGLLPTGCQKSTDTPTPESAQIESSVTETTNPFESESDTLKSNSEIKPSESETSGGSSFAPENSNSISEISELSLEMPELDSSEAENSNSISRISEPSAETSNSASPEAETSNSISKNNEPSAEASKTASSQPESSKEVSSQPSEPKPTPEPSKTPIENSPSPTLPSVVKLNKSSLAMTVGETYQLSATIEPSDADDRQLTWYWSDTAVITIDQNAVVHAVGAGTATITVKTNNNKQATCEVTVKAKEQPKPVEQSSKPTETSKPVEVSKPTETSQPTQTSKPVEASKQSETSAIDPLYAPYYYPCDWDAIIADLRKVGEEQYGMTWEDSLWVADKGNSYGSFYDDIYGYDTVYDDNGKAYHQGHCQFGFPEGLTETKINWWETDKPFQNDGETFRYACVNMFKDLERSTPKLTNGRGTMKDWYFKIVVEDVGLDLNGDHDYWVYLLRT